MMAHANASHVSTKSKSDLRADLARDGFIVIRSIITEPQLSLLRKAAQSITASARAGNWPFIRTLPKQFPPWSTDPSSGIWGVQHLMHPSQPDSRLWAESYFSDGVMDIIRDLLLYDGTECKDTDLVMELYNLLVRPDADFELRWHRDDLPPEATSEEELLKLNGHEAWHAQWNLALYEDASLVVIPGSHVRARTDVERNAGPYERTLPGILVVKLDPGDVVFYNNNILHRGVYRKDKERMTLHGSVGHVDGNGARARNVLQHGIGAWIADADFSGLDEKLKTRAEIMRGNLSKIGNAAVNVGYSQAD